MREARPPRSIFTFLPCTKRAHCHNCPLLLSLYSAIPRNVIKWEMDPKLVDLRTRSIQKENLLVVGKSQKLQSTFYSDAASLWNKAPDSIKNAKSLFTVKKEIKKFILYLPIWWISFYFILFRQGCLNLAPHISCSPFLSVHNYFNSWVSINFTIKVSFH